MLFVVKFLGTWLIVSVIFSVIATLAFIYGALGNKEAFSKHIEGMNDILFFILTVIALPMWLLYVLFKWIKGD